MFSRISPLVPLGLMVVVVFWEGISDPKVLAASLSPLQFEVTVNNDVIGSISVKQNTRFDGREEVIGGFTSRYLQFKQALGRMLIDKHSKGKK